MFEKKEIDLMRSLGLNFAFDDLSDEEWVRIEEAVSDRLVLNELDEKYNPTPQGILCEAILDKLP